MRGGFKSKKPGLNRGPRTQDNDKIQDRKGGRRWERFEDEEKPKKKEPFDWRAKKEQLKKKRENYASQNDHEEVPIDYKPTKTVSKEVYNSDSSEEEETFDADNEIKEMMAAETKKKKVKGSGGFQSLGLSYPVFKAILKKGYKLPTPIQRKTLPVILDGKDVVAMARTGSGKTAAFLIPMIEKLKTHAVGGARALILSPTRELALQTYKFTREFARFTTLNITMILGGDSMDKQFQLMHSSPDVIIATPGRLLHVLVEMNQKLNEIIYVVFDEADRLFEMGFQEQLEEIIQRMPDNRQTLLFSATLPKLLVEFAKAGLNEPELIRLDVETKLSENLKTAFITCRDDDKEAILLHLLKNVINPEDMTLIFVATRHHVDYIVDVLGRASIETTHVYSSLDAEARKININKFRSKKVKVMIVTDLAARGIDIPILDNVINHNFPCKSKLFVHRVGRVARAGRSGTAYSLVTPDEVPFMIELHMFMDKELELAKLEGENKDDGVVGSVPQDLIDDEADSIKLWHESSYDLQSMKQVCKNAMKQYIKSRSVPCPESVKKSKDVDLEKLPSHPVFRLPTKSQTVNGSQNEEVEQKEERSKLLMSIKSFKPTSTIFEISSNKKNESASVMSEKRKFHEKLVAKTKLHKEKEKELIYGTKKSAEKFRDEEFFLSHAPDSYATDRGLEIEGKAMKSAFDSAVLEVIGDEDGVMRKNKSNMKWDRKKKKFVNETGMESKKSKKVKTESGNWISASYSSDLYKKWKDRQKVSANDDDDGNDDGGHKVGVQRKRRNAHSNPMKEIGVKTKGSKGRAPKRELKRHDEILKVRLKEEKKKKIMESRKSGKGQGRPGGLSGKMPFKGRGGGRR